PAERRQPAHEPRQRRLHPRVVQVPVEPGPDVQQVRRPAAQHLIRQMDRAVARIPGFRRNTHAPIVMEPNAEPPPQPRHLPAGSSQCQSSRSLLALITTRYARCRHARGSQPGANCTCQVPMRNALTIRPLPQTSGNAVRLRARHCLPALNWEAAYGPPPAPGQALAVATEDGRAGGNWLVSLVPGERSCQARPSTAPRMTTTPMAIR